MQISRGMLAECFMCPWALFPNRMFEFCYVLILGERTFGVLTKLDLMDKGTNALDVWTSSFLNGFFLTDTFT